MKNSLSDTLFSIHRFTDLCRKEMVENWKTNAMRFVLLYGVLTVLFLWNGAYEYDRYADEVPDYLTEDPQWQIVVIFTLIGLMLSGLLSSSFVMEGMRNKTGRINLLMTPATSFEKFITRWIIYTFAFLLLYLIAFKLADWTRVLFFSAVHPQLREVIAPVPPNIVLGEDARHWAVFQEVGKFRLAVSFYFFCQSLYVLGSTLWPKNAFLKTTTALVLVAMLFVGVGACSAELFIPDGFCHVDAPFGLDEEGAVRLSTLLLALGACVLWILAYFRFKESEIIQRW